MNQIYVIDVDSDYLIGYAKSPSRVLKKIQRVRAGSIRLMRLYRPHFVSVGTLLYRIGRAIADHSIAHRLYRIDLDSLMEHIENEDYPVTHEKLSSDRTGYMRRYRRIDIEVIRSMLDDPGEFVFVRDDQRRKRVLRATPGNVDREAIRNVYRRAVEMSDQYGIDFVVVHSMAIRKGGSHVAENLEIISPRIAESRRIQRREYKF